MDQFRQAGEMKRQFSDLQTQSVETFPVKRPAAPIWPLYEELASRSD